MPRTMRCPVVSAYDPCKHEMHVLGGHGWAGCDTPAVRSMCRHAAPGAPHVSLLVLGECTRELIATAPPSLAPHRWERCSRPTPRALARRSDPHTAFCHATSCALAARTLTLTLVFRRSLSRAPQAYRQPSLQAPDRHYTLLILRANSPAACGRCARVWHCRLASPQSCSRGASFATALSVLIRGGELAS